MSASDRLRQKIGVALPAFGATAWRIWDSPSVHELYPEYLCTMHCIVRSSVPLMQAAIARSHELEGDPVAAGVAAYLSEHVGEEMGHDEWVLQDLEATGRDRNEPLHRIPPPSVAAVVGSQYYWIRHHHPVALMGHIAVMEGYPPTVRLAEHLQVRTGYGPDAFRSLARHAMLDIHHRDEFLEVVDTLPLAEEHEALIGVSALHTIRGLIDVFEQILEREAVPAP
ncbi:MAG TPA: iron-containing redox enzyme family protein [Gaiellaceae bacterium]|jgi:hypothetical protein